MVNISVGLRLGSTDYLASGTFSEEMTAADLLPLIERVQKNASVMRLIDQQLFCDFKSQLVPKKLRVVLVVDGTYWSDKLAFPISSDVLDYPLTFRSNMAALVEAYFIGKLSDVDEAQAIAAPKKPAKPRTAEQIAASRAKAEKRAAEKRAERILRLELREVEERKALEAALS